MAILTTSVNSGGKSELYQFTQGIEQDRRLATQEIQVQLAWAEGLCQLGVLTTEEFKNVETALNEAGELIQSGKFDWRVRDEDIHMNLERFITDKFGALGKKMHFGRSRNDLIATTLRLNTRDTLDEVISKVERVILAICNQAEANLDIIIPGLTHVQHGQPIRLGHAFSAHGWAFLRDIQRMRSAQAAAMNRMPAGSAALAGTSLSIDLVQMAKNLGFKTPSANSYDSVGDRDFIVEAIDAMASLAVHLSRISEDLVYYSSTAVGLIQLPYAWSTGSSIMPNKRNPDVPELIRAKCAHIMSCSHDAHTLLKGVAMSYGSDLHEIKQVYQRALDESLLCLGVLAPFISEMKVNSKVANELVNKGHILATEIADELTHQGVPFRDAYAQVAKLVEAAERLGCQVEKVSADQAQIIAPKLSSEFLRGLSVEAAVEKRNNHGGTARKRALQSIDQLKKELRA